MRKRRQTAANRRTSILIQQASGLSHLQYLPVRHSYITRSPLPGSGPDFWTPTSCPHLGSSEPTWPARSLTKLWNTTINRTENYHKQGRCVAAMLKTTPIDDCRKPYTQHIPSLCAAYEKRCQNKKYTSPAPYLFIFFFFFLRKII